MTDERSAIVSGRRWATPPGAFARPRAALVALVALATLAGCGGDDAGAGPASLQEALGMDRAALQERFGRVQEAVRQCMQAQGFEYVPVDPADVEIRVARPGGDDTAEFRRTYGYGITTQLGERDQSDDRDDNPNERIRSSLSEQERRAWDRALWGDAADESVPGGGVIIRRGPGGGDEAEPKDDADLGCFRRAERSVPGNGPEQLGPALEELDERVRSDPRMVQADAAWARCMSEAGYSYERPTDVFGDLFRRLQDVAPMEPAAGPPDRDDPALRRLQQEELAIARADHECDRRTRRSQVEKKVRSDAERRFLDEHPDLLRDGEA